jgi:hypothetical protein
MATRDALVSEIRDRLTRTNWPRLTILIILAFAGSAAFLTSVACLVIGLDSMASRYALASIAGYLAFVVLIRGWIAIRRGWEPNVDLPDPFDTSMNLEPVEKITCVHQASSSAGDAGSGFSIDLDDGIFIVIAILAALGGVACIAYVIYIAPLLLAEVALDAALVSAAYRRLRQEDAGHWTGAVLRRTWVPAAFLVIFMSGAGFAAQRIAPDARSIGDVVRTLTAAEAAEAPDAPDAPDAPEAAQEPAAERLVGLLNLPDMIPQPCGPETPVSLNLYATPSAAKAPIGALAYEVSGRTPNGVACNGIRTVLRRVPGGAVESVPMEESDYEVSSAIVYQQSGPWFRIALTGGSAWIRRDDSKDFLRYPEMLQERLTHLAAGWDGRLWRTPGASSARAVSPEVKSLLKAMTDANSDVDVDVLAVRRIRGEAWIQVRVLNAHCGDGDHVTIDTGWVPAYRATREPSVWFYSRGC